MNYINYKIHKIIWSKYRLLINLLIFSLIYFSFYAETYYSFCMKNAGPSESKDTIIRELREQVQHLRIEKDFLSNNLNNVIKELFDIKHEHLNDLKKAKEENMVLQLQQLQRTAVTPFMFSEVKASSVIPITEDAIEAESLESFNAPLIETNRKLQSDYNIVLRELQESQVKLREASVRPICEDKQTQVNFKFLPRETKPSQLELDLSLLKFF